MTSRPNTTTSDRPVPVRGPDKVAQMKRESDRRVEAQRVASQQMTAKIQRLRTLRLERDALAARQSAEAAALEPPKAAAKRKSPSPKAAAAAKTATG